MQRRRKPWNEELSIGNQKTTISVQDKEFLRRYYEKVFINLQQTNCRVIAKAYVKLVEPRKQVKYPYNGRKIVDGKTQQLHPDETKPPWWPSGVSHREPDHLPKAGETASPLHVLISTDRREERIRLLVHILCELRTSHGITTQRLKEADQPIRRQITPVERLQILDEVYLVREEEEKFLKGESGMVIILLIYEAPILIYCRWQSDGVNIPGEPPRHIEHGRQPGQAQQESHTNRRHVESEAGYTVFSYARHTFPSTYTVCILVSRNAHEPTAESSPPDPVSRPIHSPGSPYTFRLRARIVVIITARFEKKTRPS